MPVFLPEKKGFIQREKNRKYSPGNNTTKNMNFYDKYQFMCSCLCLLLWVIMKRIRLIFTWFFIALLLFTNLRVNLMYGLYSVDKELFIDLFCVNKDNPEMECDGTCMLDKLASHTHDDHNDMPPVHHIFQVELNFYVIDLNFELIPFTESVWHHYKYLNSYTFLSSENIEHPPLV